MTCTLAHSAAEIEEAQHRAAALTCMIKVHNEKSRISLSQYSGKDPSKWHPTAQDGFRREIRALEQIQHLETLLDQWSRNPSIHTHRDIRLFMQEECMGSCVFMLTLVDNGCGTSELGEGIEGLLDHFCDMGFLSRFEEDEHGRKIRPSVLEDASTSAPRGPHSAPLSQLDVFELPALEGTLPDADFAGVGGPLLLRIAPQEDGQTV